MICDIIQARDLKLQGICSFMPCLTYRHLDNIAMRLQRLQIVAFMLSSTLALSTVLPRDDGPIVQVQQGNVQGVVKSTPEGNEFYAFLGIPFAKPPIDELRYKAPVPADAWTGIFQATTDSPECLQAAFGVTFTAGEEDCLYLNVFTPTLPTTGNRRAGPLPVQVFIHGGAFIGGDIVYDNLGPERYMNTPMVLVDMNYRLGALGFLSTGDAAASGNYGLLDQNLALKWVRNNIAVFDGDPNQVTLTGQSAGSSSIIFHMLSPMSAGLFHRAIAESGSAMCPWALQETPLQYAQDLGKLFGCPTDESTTALVDCLRLQDPVETTTKATYITIERLALAFVPVVENAETGLFLTEDPTTLLEQGRFNQVPIVLGFNRDEGVLIYQYIFLIGRNINDAFFNDQMTSVLRVLTHYRQNLVNVSYAIKAKYYDGLDITNQTAVDITNIDVISDMFMKSWITKTGELMASHGVPTYFYVFDYVSSYSSSNFTGEPDVTHGSEMKFLFNTSALSEKDSIWGVQFFDMWVNFITQGNPSPYNLTWVPNTNGGSSYVEINVEFAQFPEYDPEMMRFWFEEVPAIVHGDPYGFGPKTASNN